MIQRRRWLHIIRTELTTLVLLILNVIFVQDISAQVIINEVSPASSPEWVEIYNISSFSASLKDYAINFGSETQNKFFCDAEVINGGVFKLIILAPTTHWLSDSSDIVTLKNGDDVIDSIGYGTGYSSLKPKSSDSITRSPNGSTTWILTNQPTQQGDVVSFDCPTPTPTPVPEPTPFPTPVPSEPPAKNPTPFPTPTKTPKPTLKPILLIETPISQESTMGAVLAESVVSSSPALLVPAETQTKETSKKFPLLAILFIVLGLTFIGFSVFSILKNVKKSYTVESENENSQIS